MDPSHRRALVSLRTATLAVALALGCPAEAPDPLPSLRQALRLITSVVRAPAAPAAPPATITTGTRG